MRSVTTVHLHQPRAAWHPLDSMFEGFVDGAHADLQRFRNLLDTRTVGSQHLHPTRDTLVARTRSAELHTTGFGASASKGCSFKDHRPFIIGETGEQVKHELPGWRGGVDLLFNRDEVGVMRLERIEDVETMLQASPKPIDRVDEHRVKRSKKRVVQQSGEFDAVILSCGTGNRVRIDRDDVVAASLGILAAFKELNVCRLPCRRNSSINGDALHPYSPSILTT